MSLKLWKKMAFAAALSLVSLDIMSQQTGLSLSVLDDLRDAIALGDIAEIQRLVAENPAIRELDGALGDLARQIETVDPNAGFAATVAASPAIEATVQNAFEAVSNEADTY